MSNTNEVAALLEAAREGCNWPVECEPLESAGLVRYVPRRLSAAVDVGTWQVTESGLDLLRSMVQTAP